MTQTNSLSERSVAYERMAAALEYMGETWRGWPDLEACAREAGLSPSHFQKEFSLWAGLSPHQYQTALAHGAAGDLLRQGASVLEASLETGLSGPGRLHDLFIAHEGLSPGEAKSGGKGTDLKIGRAPTPFGDGVWLMSARGLVALGFVDEDAPERTGFVHQGRSEADAFADLQRRYPAASIERDDAEAGHMAVRVFETDEPLPVALYGTPFRRQVWRALLDIPYGMTRTYATSCRLGDKHDYKLEYKMSGTATLIAVIMVYVLWAAVLAVKWRAVRTLQKDMYPLYIKDGTLEPSVTEDDFAHTFMRVEGPRFGLYLFAGALAAPFLIVIALGIFNFIWAIVWKKAGELPWFQVGELPHSLMTIFLYVAILFGTAWVTMRQYHMRAPRSLRVEINRLNGGL